MTTPLLRIRLRRGEDVVLARRRSRQLAEQFGLDPQEQVRLATAVSEIARNAVQYAGGGWVHFELNTDGETVLLVRIEDDGPGIPHLDAVLAGTYQSPSGLGVGLVGARRLSDRFRVESTPGRGTSVELGKVLPAGRRAEPVPLAELGRRLAAAKVDDPVAELEMHNQELLRVLAILAERQAETDRLNAELNETNRGVLALYAELDDRATELARVSQLKSAFLSGITHELRTPLNSILNLTRILLERMDGPLNPEQEVQVTMIQRAATTLTDLVTDLLDLARIEAGKIDVRLASFTINDLFGALRGMFRPLLTSDQVVLIFESPDHEVTVTTHEGRLSQILRNLISNAIKFTERGEIRVVAAPAPDDTVRFSVTDTGIGIAPEDQVRIFEEFTQVDNPLQRHVRGTGLGLPLSRKLAGLLGGRLEVRSTPGVGSCFELLVPRIHRTLTIAPAESVTLLVGAENRHA